MIDLTGLSTGPAQTWGAVRLVPLLRDEPIRDLRLHPRLYGPEPTVVRVAPRTYYTSYVPHAFVATWSSDAAPTAAHGTQLLAGDLKPARCGMHFRRRMARREDRNRLRFLPLHLALEGYLALHFAGPSTAWPDWTRRALTDGLSPRVETVYGGGEITGLDDALRIFEIHPDQCGMVLYLADALAAAFVVPHPQDYRALHTTLLLDFYGELVHQYAHMYPAVPEFRVSLDAADLPALRTALATARQEWAAFHDTTMVAGLLAAPATTSTVYRLGRFTLSRFLPAFDPSTENHIGETITDADGRLAYLKTFRLSAAQARRGYLLSRLAEHHWDVDATATAMGTDRPGLVARIDRAGFGHLLRPERRQSRSTT